MNFRQLFKEIAIYGGGDTLLKATAIITMPIYTRLFTPEDYGIWNFVVTCIALISGILALGGESAYARYFFEVKTLQEKQVVTSTWLAFLTLWGVVAIAIMLPFTGIFSYWSLGTDEYGLFFSVALISAPVVLINGMCGQVLRNQFKGQLFTLLNVLTTLLSIGFSLFAVVVLSLGIIGLVGGALAAAVLMLHVRLWTARAMLKPVFSLAMLRSLLAYGVPLVPVSLAYWIFGLSDRLVLGKYAELEQVGLYAVANSTTSVLGFANSALGQAWSPHAIRVYEDARAHSVKLYGQIMTYILTGFGILAVGFTTFALEALMVLSTPAFYPAAIIVGPLALGIVASASTQITALGISLTKRTRYITLYSWLAALLNLGLNIWLVPRWGMVAAGWTTFLSYLFLTIAYLLRSQRLWPVVYEKRKGVVIVVLTVCFVVFAPRLPSLVLLASLSMKGAYCLAYIGSLFLFRGLDQREWLALTKAWQEMRGSRAESSA